MSNLLEQASLVLIPSGYKEDVVYSQIPLDGSGDMSFARSSNGTRINSAGLVEVTPWNLLGYSEQFDNGVWSKYQSSVIANITTAPNGTNTADSIIENNGTDVHITFQIVTISAGVATISVYAKADTRNHIVLYSYDNVSQFYFSNVFNLSNGTTTGANQSIENVGNGWYRCSFTFTTTVSGSHYTYVALSNGTSINYAGNGSGQVYIWGFQLNIGSTAKPYFPTTDRLNVPRLTYQNGGGGCPSLLLEKQSTNLMYPSEDFTNANYSGANYTMVANEATSPDGTQNADKFTTTSTSADNYMRYGTFAIISNIGSSYTTTIYAKKGTADFLIIRNLFVQNGASNGRAWFNLNTGAVGTVQSSQTASMQSMGNGWYRCVLTGVVGSTNTFDYIDFAFTNSDNTIWPSANVNGYLWGSQLEAGSYATSYIPSTSSSATRVSDACFKTSISSLIGQTEGVLFVDFEFLSGAMGEAYIIRDVVFGTYVYINQQTSGNIFGQIQGVGAVVFSTPATNGRYKCAIAYKSGDSAFFVNGAQVGSTNTNTFVPVSMTLFEVLTPTLNKVNQAVLFKTRLTNAELALLTSL